MTTPTKVLPFRPTRDQQGYPTACLTCGFHAHGIGIGNPQQDPHYLCPECMTLLTEIKDIRQWNGYERAAVDHAIEAVGPMISKNGTDLSTWSSDQVEEFVRAVWAACGDGVRDAVKNGTPF